MELIIKVKIYYAPSKKIHSGILPFICDRQTIYSAVQVSTLISLVHLNASYRLIVLNVRCESELKKNSMIPIRSSDWNFRENLHFAKRFRMLHPIEPHTTLPPLLTRCHTHFEQV